MFDRLGAKSKAIDAMASKADSGLVEKLKARLAGLKPGQGIGGDDRSGPAPAPEATAIAGGKPGVVDVVGTGGGEVPPPVETAPAPTPETEADPLEGLDAETLQALLEELLKNQNTPAPATLGG